MPSYPVIAVDYLREVFVLQTDTGECAVCWVLSGPVIHIGDSLSGDLPTADPRRKGHLEFSHPEGRCRATGETGLVSRQQALRTLHDGRIPPLFDPVLKPDGQPD